MLEVPTAGNSLKNSRKDKKKRKKDQKPVTQPITEVGGTNDSEDEEYNNMLRHSANFGGANKDSFRNLEKLVPELKKKDLANM